MCLSVCATVCDSAVCVYMKAYEFPVYLCGLRYFFVCVCVCAPTRVSIQSTDCG